MAHIFKVFAIGRISSGKIETDSNSGLYRISHEAAKKSFYNDLTTNLTQFLHGNINLTGHVCNHFHLLVRMRPDTGCSDSELKKRLAAFYDKEPIFYEDGQLPAVCGFYRILTLFRFQGNCSDKRIHIASGVVLH